MKKILITLSIIALALCSANAQKSSSWKSQKLLIGSATQTESAAKLGKKGTLSFGGSLNRVDQDYIDGNIGGGAYIDLQMAAFKSANKNFGIDVSIPVKFDYMSADDKTDTTSLRYSRTDIPVQLLPYFRYAFSKNFVVSPFLFAGAGVSINHVKLEGVGSRDETAFMYKFGGGVEFLVYKGLALTPKFTYTKLSDVDDYSKVVGLDNGTLLFETTKEFAVEAAIQLVRGWAFTVEYAYQFDNEGFFADDVNGHFVRAGFRFGF